MKHSSDRARRLADRCAVRAFVLTALLPLPAFAHGGQYRGPGETAPPGQGSTAAQPSSSGNGVTTGGSTAPPAPAAGPTSSPTATPLSGRGPAGGGRRGINIGPDYHQWQFWWEYNKERYLGRRSSRFGRGETEHWLGRGVAGAAIEAPSMADLRAVLPPLLATLQEAKTSPDVASSCMIAIARIGIEAGCIEAIRPFLDDANQEKRETAALALGIAGLPAAAPLLEGLALGKWEQKDVDVRTRAFALYGLAAGSARRADFVAEPGRLQATLVQLSRDSAERDDVRVAAVHALTALARREPDSGLARATLVELRDLMRDENAMVAAHATIATGRILEHSSQDVSKFVASLAELLGRTTASRDVRRSACIALGHVRDARSFERVSEVLRQQIETSRDLAVRRFATIALGEVGAADGLDYLIARLQSGKLQEGDRVWTALALGIGGRSLDRDGEAKVRQRISDALRREFEATKQGLPASGIALALSLVGSRDVGAAILDRLQAHRNDDEAASYFALALGLLREREHRDVLREISVDSVRREILLTQGAIALGLLEDPEIVHDLTTRLSSAASVTAKSSVARALGFHGDRSSLGELVKMLEDRSHPDLARAFAAVAIGLACDREELPWNARFAAGSNYHAQLETLVGGSAGILDIL